MPNTPSTRLWKNQEDIDQEIERIIKNLNDEWKLNLPLPKDVIGSPEKRGTHKEQKCYNAISFLACKREVMGPVKEFVVEADILYSKWVHKPRAERGVIPEANRRNPKPVTADERAKLLYVLHKILTEKSDAVKLQQAMSPRSWRQYSLGENPPTLDDSPLKFPSLKHDSKRPREDAVAENISKSKKVKTPEKSPEALSSKSANTMLPPTRGRSEVKDLTAWRSANTSFESNANSSIFSNSQSMRASMLPNTQETVPDPEEGGEGKEDLPAEANHTSSEFNPGSSFEAALATTSDPNGLMLGSELGASTVDDELSQDIGEIAIEPDVDLQGTMSKEDMLKERLEQIFSQPPSSLNPATFAVNYEVTRVFLYAGVPLTDVELQDLDLSTQHDHDYERLWKSLRNLPALIGKDLPEKSEPAAWNAAQTSNGFIQGPHGVVFSGSLRFNESDRTGPFFRLQLQPMKLDLAHRLGRRFGHDRFLELDMPSLNDRHVPDVLRELGDRGRDIVIEHLVDANHRLFGRTWKPFYCKPKDRKERKRDILTESTEETVAAAAHRVYLFAVDGRGFRIVRNALRDLPSPESHPRINIQELLNMVRPTRKNTHQPFLKLFARTSLALSKNNATIILERSQIHDKQDLTFGPEKEVMTDGAGRMSYTLALKVTTKLGLSYLPWGFQGRLGEAKGFWIIDHRDKAGEDWIEVYESQQKWKRSQKRGGESDDPSHRTFEVNRPSGPLKSADLNLQLLPLLIDRARNKPQMRQAIAKLPEDGLKRALEELKAGMDDAASLREWIGESNSNIKEKVKAGRVPFRAGLPSTIEDRLNHILESGFHPMTLKFVREMTRSLFKGKCDELKNRLNITVGKSTYAYMVPDFWGVLEPDEVYIDFSSFKDNVSGFAGVRLNGEEVLVARSPAHFVSDVQKVKAVVKVELMGLQDVVIFPIKGNPSLAQKLSGGDYDGDMAWICWEPSIVKNFETAEVPKMPDLVAEGYITEDKTKYHDLVKGQKDTVSYFLKKAFSFNMQESMLGICTSFKEGSCYFDKSADSLSGPPAVYMSTLLSSLVDQAKQGYLFDEDSWKRFKADRVKVIPKQPPLYKNKTGHLDPNAKHIIDYLKYVADETVEKALADFHSSMPASDSLYWDDDLTEPFADAMRYAIHNNDWKVMLDQLEVDLTPIKEEWRLHFAKKSNDESKATFAPFRDKIYEKFIAIQPRGNATLVQALTIPDGSRRHPDTSEWARLKASALFSSYTPTYVSNIVWWISGRQLCQIKASCSKDAAPHYVVPSMYKNLKPNKTIIKLSKAAGSGPSLPDGSGISTVGELDDADDDD
ncbi:RNA-dependent RNA polymerase [Lachnellula suecica]|uniref:RNA-dependent RNA polymerase n=1 Tax=Lachnellula suecica TaxID=602035 RepID=A0A8T9CD23_9HELO|nr:RNA-dependent RNA polymerase [Lachnellula suecica]